MPSQQPLGRRTDVPPVSQTQPEIADPGSQSAQKSALLAVQSKTNQNIIPNYLVIGIYLALIIQ
jgi:hypothetical protein